MFVHGFCADKRYTKIDLSNIIKYSLIERLNKIMENANDRFILIAIFLYFLTVR